MRKKDIVLRTVDGTAFIRLEGESLSAPLEWCQFSISALENHIGDCMLGAEDMLTKWDKPFKIQDLSFHASCGGGARVIFSCLEKKGYLSIMAGGDFRYDDQKYFKAFDQMLYDCFKDNEPRDVTVNKGCVFPISFILHILGVI